jgi:serine/threonine protein kinase
MEYLSGGSLKERLAKEKYSIESCITLLQHVGAGLSLAHKHNYIHRDIKPANILFSKHDTAILTDFGIAKLQDTCSDLTKMGYMLGTAQYMSPEQATTQPLDQRSDVYSLGLVFYEMLTGKKAVDGKTNLQALYQHTNAPPPTFPAQYQHLQEVLNKVLAKKPVDRFDSVQAFIDALVATNSNALIKDEKKRQKPKKEVSHLPRWAKASAIIATLGTILLTGSYFYLENEEKKGVPTITQETTVNPPPPLVSTNTDVTLKNLIPNKIPKSQPSNKKISQIYEPHIYYDKLEKDLELLAKETMELLALVPDNKQARQSLQQILDRYHSLALTFLKKMNSRKAMAVINTGLKLSVNHQPLKDLKQLIDRKPEKISKKIAKHISNLNNQAEIYSQSGNYVTPQGKNALEIYQKILTIDPHNKKTIDKINAIVSIFEKEIKQQLDKNPYKANELLNQAIAIAPFNKKLIKLQGKIKMIKNKMKNNG